MSNFFSGRAGRWLVILTLGVGTMLPARSSWADEAVGGIFDAKALQGKALSGDSVAAFQLGTIEYVGIGVVQDYIGAVRLLRSGADAGNAEAQCELGFLYQTGSFAQGPPPSDPVDAVPWYAKSAALGNAYGEFALAALYRDGVGVPRDGARAAALFAQAAAQGLTADASSFPLEQLQRHFYDIAYKLTGQTAWVDLVSTPASGER